MNNEERFKRMRYEKIPKLIISLGIPTTISMLITNIYNMADTYFVSQISLRLKEQILLAIPTAIPLFILTRTLGKETGKRVGSFIVLS